MKTTLIAIVALSALVEPAFAQSSDSMTVSGTVAPICAITAPGDATLNLVSGSQAIGGVTIQCNDPQGFSTTAASANGSTLVNTQTPNSYYPYTMNSTYGAVNFGTSVDASQIGGASLYVTSQVIDLDVSLGTVTGPSYSGVYSDVLTFTISAN